MKVDLVHAEVLVVEPDEVLVIRLREQLEEKQAEAVMDGLQQILGDRFILVGGEGVELAKVKKDDRRPSA